LLIKLRFEFTVTDDPVSVRGIIKSSFIEIWPEKADASKHSVFQQNLNFRELQRAF
jgi:hypothetical protein